MVAAVSETTGPSAKHPGGNGARRPSSCVRACSDDDGRHPVSRNGRPAAASAPKRWMKMTFPAALIARPITAPITNDRRRPSAIAAVE